MIASTSPNVHTMVAPVGRSSGERQIHAERRHDRPHRPADRQPLADAIGVQHRGNRRHDEVAEHQQHAGNRHRRGDHEAERRVEQEVPEPDRDPFGLRPFGIHRDRQKLVAKHVVEDSDCAVQKRGLPDFGPRHREDVADQHVLQVLALRGRLAHRQDRRRRRHGVADADDRFLRNARRWPANRARTPTHR